MAPPPTLGVVLVTYDASDVILDALETLLASALQDGVALRIIVVDNASTDDTVTIIRDWASGVTPYTPSSDLPFSHITVSKPLGDSWLDLIEAECNRGFAAGVNIGLRALFSDPKIDRVWVLNPDCVVPSGTCRAYATYNPGQFSLMGGRLAYLNSSDCIQADGGKISWNTGVTHSYNQYGQLDCPPPSKRN